MIDNTWHYKHTTKEDRRLFGEVIGLILKTSDYVQTHKYREYLSFECHSIAMAISQLIPKLKCVHGFLVGLRGKKNNDTGEIKFTTEYTHHSWLETPDGSIIDAYPVGFMSCNPVLVITKGPQSSSGGELYIKHEETVKKYIGSRMYRKSLILADLIKKSEYTHTSV